jgi:D-alanyl-D-alanine carboxypeptidase
MFTSTTEQSKFQESIIGIPSDYAKSRGLLLQVEATRLVSIGKGPEGGEIELTPEAADAWARMKNAASIAGIPLVAISGFRTVKRQEEIIRAKLSAGQTIESILETVAAPGYSEHHTGRAIDIGLPGEEPLTEDFGGTSAYRWLEANAGSFGFFLSYPRGNPHGISYEPWHWCCRSGN